MFVTSHVRYRVIDLVKYKLTMLSTARCLYPAQCVPSTLYDSVYVVTLSSLLYRPCVATFVTAVTSPRSICSHWFSLLLLGHHALISLPLFKKFSRALEGPWLLLTLLEAVIALSRMRLSSIPRGTEHLWTLKGNEKVNKLLKRNKGP